MDKENDILKKLRQRFVALIMGILALLLTVVSVVVCYVDWSNSYEHANEVLDLSMMAAEGQGGPVRIRDGMELDPDAYIETPPQEIPEEDELQEAPEMEGFQGIPDGPVLHERPQKRNIDVPVATYALIGDKLEPLPGSSGLLDDDTLEEASTAIRDASDGMAQLPDLGLVYMKQEQRGVTFVSFAEDSILDGWQGLALALAAVELVVLALFFMVSVAFSKWALRPVQEAWEKQRRFISDASHELKTPLSIASANTSILLDEPDMSPRDREEWLSRSAAALDGMRALIDDMLDLASLDEAGDDDPVSGARTPCGRDADAHPSECEDAMVDLSRVVGGAVLQFESVAYERGFDIVEDICDGVMSSADVDAVKRIVGIILDNACKYVDEGGRVGVVVRSLDDGIVQFTVSNTGSYIPPDDVDHIFDRFYRADEVRSRGEGHGLGLSIAKGILDDVGGSIEVESVYDPAMITTFTVTLPR